VQETNRKLEAANAELERLFQHAQGLAETQSRFFAHVSHELRTPLTLILGPADKLLTAPDLAPDQLRDLRVISRNARTLLRHVDDLLDVVKHRSGQMTLAYAKTDLAQLVRLSAAHFDSVSGNRGVRLIVQAPETLPAEADAPKIERVLINLLSNAFKFAADGGRIVCRLAREKGEAILSVEDDGPGVTPELRDKVFDAFRQGEDVMTRRAGGTGLGLAIVKDFVTLHRGSVLVRDGAKGGALFECRIPLTAPEGARVAQDERGAQNLAPWNFQQATEAVAPAETPVEPMQYDDGAPLVLVVEDNPDMRAFVAWTMAKRYRVATAADGREGFTRATELLPDLVISDMMMPEMTGEQLALAMQDHPALKYTPVLLLTARADDETRIESLRHGVADFLAKPCTETELEARAANLIRTKQSADLDRRGRRISEKRYAQLMDQARAAVFVLNGAGIVLSSNKRATSMVGRAAEDIVGKPFEPMLNVPNPHGLVSRLLERTETRLTTLAASAKDQKVLEITASKTTIENEDFVLVIVRDATEQALLEDSLRRMQKLDALGQMTGGMAHDFNNLLGAITTSLYSLRQRLPDDDRTNSIVATMQESADRGADLMRRLLSFARNQSAEAETIRLDGLVERQAEMLRNILPSSIRVETKFSPTARPVHIDKAQFEDGLLNLAINARDAMPKGGALSIEIANADNAGGMIEGFGELKRGPYVRVSVADTGEGMTPETRARVFEPFFTTKEVGKGTGLGLAMVYGLVKQAGGYAAIASTPGEGTRIDLFFPPAQQPAQVLGVV
jgi:PAS domain S-box-containing protein